MNYVRVSLGNKYIQGNGIEIGALHFPLKLSSNTAKVLYVDRLSAEELYRHYPELQKFPLHVDIVDNGEILKSIPDNSLSFIIANHMIEHCRNPIQTIQTHLNKLKVGGILYYAIPDKRFTFDSKRELTTFSHLLEDYNGNTNDFPHYLNWVKFSECIKGTEEEILNRAKMLMEQNYSIHFHTWTPSSFINFLEEFNHNFDRKFFEVLCCKNNMNEFIVVLKKLSF